MIAKKIEESNEAGSILGAAARLMGAVTERPHGDTANDLLAAISAYYEGMEAFNQNDLIDNDEIQALAAVTYEPPTEALQQWSVPARNHEEAVAALRLATVELDRGDDSVVEPMVKAAFHFFDGKQAAQQQAPSILSLEPSADFDFALKALSYLETRKDEAWSQICVYENECHDGRFRGDFEGWKEWAKSTPHPFLQWQYETLSDLAIALEKFVCARESQSVGDLVAKMQLNALWIRDDMGEVIENYSEESCLLIKSILPLVERLTANKAEGAAKGRAPLTDAARKP
ncbi:hypothetical protein HHL25_14165 [Rhizobium sp. S-51]|uniref:Uncharacterized protein n=1 Tax=Rhizobium terricola TaxID=2728849 RepID=A0A7Y0AXN6_9HYPH|nr:hypothetical protein [Rhizobium terricola]NML75272.1 hypothetical protein [Rhizobium terricola]